MTEHTRHPRTWPADVRERALELIRETGGLAAAHRELGVPKVTLSAWKDDAGIDLSPMYTDRVKAANDAAVAAAAERRRELLDNVAAQAVETSRVLRAVAEAGADYVAALEDVDAAGISAVRDQESGAWLVTVPEAATEALARAAALAQLPVSVRDLVGIQTRAISDVELLEGRATSRGEVRVVVQVPRPDPVGVGEVVVVGDVLPSPTTD